MVIKKYLLFSLILAGLSGQINAQKYNIKTYSVNDGLPTSYVYDVIVEDRGFTWFATSSGLVRFDGLNYKVYKEENGLKDELISDIYKDQYDEFWVSTELGGVAKLVNDSLIYIPELAVLDTILVNFIYDGLDGTLWFGTNNNGLFEWDRKGNAVQKLTVEQGLTDNQIWDLLFDDDGKMWVSTSSGVTVYKNDEGIIQKFTQESGLSGEIIYKIIQAKNGNKWAATSNGISIIMPNGSIEHIVEINGRELDYVFSIAEDDEGVIWIGTERDGLYWYDGKTFTHVKENNGLSTNKIYNLSKDFNGNIWVATDGGGVNLFRDREFQFYDGSTEADVNSIYSALKAKDGTLWFGTEDGLSSYKNNTFTKHNLPIEIFEDDEIWDIEELPNGNLLVLTFNYDILEYDGDTFFRPDFFDALYEYYVTDILVEDDGTIWFTAFQTLLKYKNGELQKFLPPDENYWQTNLTFIRKDSKGFFWIGSHGGLARFDKKEFIYYTKSDGLLGNSIQDLKEDQKGNLWVGTDSGISVLSDFDDDGLPQKIQPYETSNLYLQETIFLQFDAFGNLWQSTNGGLNYYDIEKWWENGEVCQQHFPFNDFGNGLEFNGWASILDDDGTLWFGSNTRGLVKYSFKEGMNTLFKDPLPKVFLREVLVNNRKIYSQFDDNELDKHLLISNSENNVNFHFNAVDYKNQNRIAYRYKLEDFDKDWSSGIDIDEVRYTNIPPGTYNFLVQAKTIKSDWSDVQTLASIQINKPFWKTPLFIFFSILFFVAFIAGFIKVSLIRLEKNKLRDLVIDQTKDLQTALDEKEVLIKEIHHRVKNNLAVVSGLLEMQSWNIPDGTAKQAIQESKMRVLAMSKIHENLYQNEDLAKVNFKKFILSLTESIASTMRYPNHEVKHIFDLDGVLIDVNIGIPIGLMINEIITNSYKHAFVKQESGIISISFHEKRKYYKLEIRDNGLGSDENILEINSSSLGITLIKSLGSQIGADVNYSGVDGSFFDIIIPKKKGS